jgi:hypothetical protein
MCKNKQLPIPVSVPSKALVCGSSLAGNPAGGHGYVCCECLCCQLEVSVRRADHSFRGVLPSVVCVCVSNFV